MFSIKRFVGICCLSTVLGLVLSFAVAMAADTAVNARITKATVKLDKNGQEYVQFIINEKRTLAGVNYTAGVPVMAFGDSVAKAKTLKEGDVLKAVCDEREFQGRKSMSIRAYIP